MTAADLLNLLIAALLLAGIYAAMSVGMTVIYGVMKIVNLAHAGFLMLGAYFVYELFERFHIDPILGAVLALPVFFAFGMGVHWLLVRWLPKSDTPTLASLLLMFGLWLVLQNVLNRTWFGRSIRALIQNPYAAQIVGVDDQKTARLTFGLGTAFAGFAGGLLGMLFSFSPDFGRPFLLRSFVIIVLGGLESVSGVALGAIMLALLETFGINVPLPVYWHGWSFRYLPPSYQQVIPFALLVVVLLILPKGLSSLFNRKWKAA